MEINTRKINDIIIIDVDGEIDLYNSNQLRSTVKNIISLGLTKLIINLDQVSYIDSSGVGALIASHTELYKKNGMLCILNAKDAVEKVFEFTRLNKFFKLYKDEHTAIESLKN